MPPANRQSTPKAPSRTPAATGRETFSEALREDHRWLKRKIRRLRTQLEQGESAERLLEGCSVLGSSLRQHFRMEEQTIFPLLLATSGEGAREVVDFLRSEHELVLRFLGEFERDLENGTTNRSVFEEFRSTLVRHQSREARMLYPLSDILCPPPLRELIRERLRRGSTAS